MAIPLVSKQEMATHVGSARFDKLELESGVTLLNVATLPTKPTAP